VARVNEIKGKRVLVVGAGVAGLTAAEALAQRGALVTVAEREQVVGGLARSYRYDGATFDVGPHRFHTDDREVESLVLDTLGADHRIIDRSSAVWLYNDYHEWPLTRASLLKLPPLVMARAFFDLFHRPRARDDSLESYILSRYGATLYEVFFRPYTEKFLSYRCRDLHRDWASAGINRAVIDRRLRFDSLLHVARTTLFPPHVETRFIYPESGGIDRFVEALSRRVTDRAGTVLTGTPVVALEREGHEVCAAVVGEDGRRIELDLLVWTAPLSLLLSLLGLPSVGLLYLAELLFNFVVRGEAVLPYQWTYYGGAALSFMRASQPTRFNPRNAGPGLDGICVEVVCQEGDDLWREPERLRRDLEKDLVRVGLVRSRDAVRDLHVERVREAYPVYTLDYPGRLDRAIEHVTETRNVALLGRTGTFWYNNMDHSVRQALDLVSALAAGASPGRWNAGLRGRRAL
jgi:protoporphyrinogen oxidase